MCGGLTPKVCAHVLCPAGTGPDRELLEIGPVYWKGGKLGAYLSYRNLTPKKLRGRGQTREDPIFLEAREPFDGPSCDNTAWPCLLSALLCVLDALLVNVSIQGIDYPT